MKSFLEAGSLGRGGLETLVDEGSRIRDRLDAFEWDGRPLAGRTVANLFFEPSTRTRLSFDLAAQRLGAHVLTFNPANSSVAKGESLRDTAETVSAIGADVLVVRHSRDRAPAEVAEWTGNAVVNAGDGMNEHPTQAVVDLLTMRRRFGRLEDLNIAIVGDIAHSRVANSLMAALDPVGANVTLAGPSHWLPDRDDLPMVPSIDGVLESSDVVYLLRVQTERGGHIDQPYIDRFQMNEDRLTKMKPAAVIMHPGPINRNVEVSDTVADSARSLIGEQVRNGVPARMAVLGALEL